MIKIQIIAVGKVKESYFSQGIAEYVQRLSRFCDVKIVEVAEETYKKTGEAQEEIIKNKECERILPLLRGKVVCLAIEGKKLSSTALAQKIDAFATGGCGEITFVIGGSYGLSNEIKRRADMLLSFSDMTFPHTLFRLMLTEQLYRAFTILSGTSYHK